MSGIAPSGMPQTSKVRMDITTPTTTSDNIIMSCQLLIQIIFKLLHMIGMIWIYSVVPSQSASESVPPPTPTSITDYLSWATSTHQSIDSQFTVADPITNITNFITATEQFF
ncbi:hypothetical protein RhiirA4_473391 [Rhizophagus irregularis]|uniref:Uncharacterized protein n=1 Tax=Rhizophagus irregularis TaxID=588596 RepID=A0A2I1H6M7_9GLOM|nr:hypothetical protein RhiirA4_473391 [Rhizophagus irregularis]